MMVWDLSAFGVEARRIRPKKGEASLRLSQSQMAEGIFFAESLAGSGEETSGRSSVMSPLGRGLALFTRRNWSRCRSTSSATNAFTGIGKPRCFDLESAIARCWPSTIQAGFAWDDLGRGISSTPEVARPSRAPGPRLLRKRTPEDRARM